ncbi:hypothetical protein ACFV2H_48910 [Streptomyces sp. NPDC059629]|uniref:hypothetical protein n=1 Tax=Streptomyces sp. NPDC059629 TaxID=3346889 RepID=UPI003691D7F3
MNRTRRTSGTAGRSRVNRSALHQGPRPGTGRRSQGARSSARRQEFALPVTPTEPLPAVEKFAGLDLPAPLPAALRAEGVAVPPGVPVTIPAQREGRGCDGRDRRGRVAGQGGNGGAAGRARRSAPGPTT